ncbi:MAG: HlyC/CorC family transporter [Clostridia bacterium]|nr:HlyC/CorC family transporter [Clostridia bacterium]
MEDGSPDILQYALLLFLLIFMSAFMSASEMALSSVSKIRMITLSDNHNKRAKRVLKLLDNYDKTLTTLLIGNNLVNIAIASLATYIVTKAWGNDFVVYSTVITTVVVFIFAESLPKCFASQCNESFTLAVSGILTFLIKILSPFSFIFTKITQLISMPFKKNSKEPTVSEDDLHDIIETIVEEGAINEEKGELVQSALEFSDTRVIDVLTPWENVQTISIDMSAEEIIDFIKNSRHSRLPAIDASGEICGILKIREYLKSYLDGAADLSLSMAEVCFASADTPINDLLPEMSSNKTHMSIVLDNSGKTIGIITMEDILEELVGEIYDEDDIGGEA